mmetsp:Transcript_25342/g.30032  ORF Transcript_25342/g.30032 Transcript_25342/m.30032 type:complete len:1094 (-) Transcript_25342:87-3368(-)
MESHSLWINVMSIEENLGIDLIEVQGNKVLHIRRAAKEQMKNSLSRYDSSQLIVYDGIDALKTQNAAKLGGDISELKSGHSENCPIIILTPSNIVSPPSSAGFMSQNTPLNPLSAAEFPDNSPAMPSPSPQINIQGSSMLHLSQEAAPLPSPAMDDWLVEAMSDPDYLSEQLKKFYGFDVFRDGQFELVSTVLQNKDALGIMATGQGKSVCFQLPSLISGRVNVCISPLISLMQDQVIKLNESVGKIWRPTNPEIACFLGSNQSADKEDRARRGDFLFVYITPEKLAANGLQLLECIFRNKGLSSICVDEAHCVSEWGHDFRPEFQNIGAVLRGSNSLLRQVPLIALTATAPPRVQADMVQSLRLNQPYTFVGSFGRKNLRFEVRTKRGGFENDLQFLVKEVLNSKGASYSKPTIIYCSTKRTVDEVREYLQMAIQGKSEVLKYHGGMSTGDREATHRAFLTGSVSVGSGKRRPCLLIVATVAFGMGIDKPDIRQVIHWGAPRTVEDYYQQAGRAGRDGGVSKCILIQTPQDFVNYMTADFYKPRHPVTNLVNDAQWNSLNKSTRALQSFCQSEECRQSVLISYLTASLSTMQSPCEGCDNCVNAKKLREGLDSRQDFRSEVFCVLQVVACFPKSSKSVLANILQGTEKAKVEYLFNRMNRGESLFGCFKEGNRPSSKTKKSVEQFVDRLISTHHIATQNSSFNKKLNHGSFNIGFQTLSLSTHGSRLLQILGNSRSSSKSFPDPKTVKLDSEVINGCFFAPPPELQETLDQIERRQEALKEEIACLPGMETAEIPKEEMQAGQGPALEAALKWARYVQGLRRKEQEMQSLVASVEVVGRAALAESVIDLLEEWRSSEAARLVLASATILSETMMKKLAICITRNPVSASLIETLGVRLGNIDDLAQRLAHWRLHKWGADDTIPITVADKLPIPEEWKQAGFGLPCFALMKPLKATHMESIALFVAGNSPEQVGVKRVKQINPDTVKQHLFEGLLNGHKELLLQSNLTRLFEFMPSPTECQQIADVFSKISFEVENQAAPLKPVIDEFDGNPDWYHKVRAYRMLLLMKYPFELVFSGGSSEQGPVVKKVKTER